jgi:hypothetical protein
MEFVCTIIKAFKFTAHALISFLACYLDSYRGKLDSTFNLTDEDTMLQIMRNERFKRLLESLRSDLETMLQICTTSITTTTNTTTSGSNNGMTSSSLTLSLYPLIKSSKLLNQRLVNSL